MLAGLDFDYCTGVARTRNSVLVDEGVFEFKHLRGTFDEQGVLEMERSGGLDDKGVLEIEHTGRVIEEELSTGVASIRGDSSSKFNNKS